METQPTTTTVVTRPFSILTIAVWNAVMASAVADHVIERFLIAQTN